MGLENIIGEKRMETLREYQMPITANSIALPGAAVGFYTGGPAGLALGVGLFIAGWAIASTVQMKYCGKKYG
jgi:hypothetical protein